jgi:hypothetical protein
MTPHYEKLVRWPSGSKKLRFLTVAAASRILVVIPSTSNLVTLLNDNEVPAVIAADHINGGT